MAQPEVSYGIDIDEYINKQQDKNSVYYKTNKYIRVCEFNMQSKGKDVIDMEQVEQLNKLNADVMYLCECDKNINQYFTNHVHITSNYGNAKDVKVFIHKNLQPKIIKTKNREYITMAVVDTTFGKIIFGCVHLIDGQQHEETRRMYYTKMTDWISNHYADLPVIIGGDTNMRENETFDDFYDAYKNTSNPKYYLTWPNRTYDDKYCKFKLKTIKNNFRFDRIYVRTCNVKRFKTINTHNSDHLMIIVDVFPNEEFETSGERNLDAEGEYKNHYWGKVVNCESLDDFIKFFDND